MNSSTDIRSVLDRQRAAFQAEGPVSAATRQGRIQRVIDLLVRHNDELCAAMGDDFGGRPVVFSMMNDVLGSLGALKPARERVAGWMADEPRVSVQPFDQFGATAWVRHQPKGVVGIVGTWNAPLFTLLAPLASVFAAGNRAVLKPSEVSPRTAAVLARVVPDFFSADELSVVTGGPEVSAAFCEQAWDHLVFTGSAEVGKKVMVAAAQNLVPVTLELGGKSPVLVGQSADITNAAERIAVGKSQNSGQLCVSPDVVWVHESQAEALVAALQVAYAGLFPQAAGNPDVVAVVNSRHFDRIERCVSDAIDRGVRVVVAGADATTDGMAQRRMPLRIVVQPPADALISQHEIFGPALVLQTYHEISDAVQQINTGSRPLALYYFGHDAKEQAWVLDHTLSGGVAINDVLMHAALHDAPFGGVGGSGMGHYQGREGFLEFSHARSVYQAGTHDPRREWGLLPPYAPHLEGMMRAAVTP